MNRFIAAHIVRITPKQTERDTDMQEAFCSLRSKSGRNVFSFFPDRRKSQGIRDACRVFFIDHLIRGETASIKPGSVSLLVHRIICIHRFKDSLEYTHMKSYQLQLFLSRIRIDDQESNLIISFTVQYHATTIVVSSIG